MYRLKHVIFSFCQFLYHRNSASSLLLIMDLGEYLSQKDKKDTAEYLQQCYEAEQAIAERTGSR